MKYSDKLRDPRWQKLRLRIFERDGFKCKFCDSGTETLNVHHLYYQHGLDPWEYDESDLLTLCNYCHEIEYNDRKEVEEDLLRDLKKQKYSVTDIQILTNHIIENLNDFKNEMLIHFAEEEMKEAEKFIKGNK